LENEFDNTFKQGSNQNDNDQVNYDTNHEEYLRGLVFGSSSHKLSTKASLLLNDDPNFNKKIFQSDQCLYANIKIKLADCFRSTDSCTNFLNCVTSLDLIRECRDIQMHTPIIWMLQVYEILDQSKFCRIPVECDSNENEYLRRLDGIMRKSFEYGSAFLDQPKVDNRIYCSKAHTLVREVRELFESIDTYEMIDNCFNYTMINNIINEIDFTAASSILDKNCLYCISENSFLNNCEIDHFGNFLSCNDSLDCITNRIRLYKCDTISDDIYIDSNVTNSNITSLIPQKETETTFLQLVASFFKTLPRSICDIKKSETSEEKAIKEHQIDFQHQVNFDIFKL
jgi:hypothetical protein